ncbi:hypothetical protein D3C76_1759770 [compost metagenome]
MEVHLVRIKAGDGVFFQQVARHFMGAVLQAWASLDDVGGDRLERGLVGGIGQRPGFGRGHVFDP